MKIILDASMLYERRYQCRPMHLQLKSSLSFAKHTTLSVIKSAEVKKKENPYCFNRHHRLYNRKRSVKYFSDLPSSFRLCFESNRMISSVLHYHTHKWANKERFFLAPSQC